ncbi:MAG TPA: sigma 54-interacting transcriptional regulator, partial [Solimonas sp.]|nr:sigma 54-interacting transcriptional regulator [Solimonas sp.]
EIGNLPLSGQVKLLRVLESGQFERLGSSRTRQVKVRALSATNAELPKLIADGGFRQDLYYRLNLIEVALPPLAERSDDVLPLAEFFVGGDAHFADEAREALLDYHWPGNVRELRNAVERARLLCRAGVIRTADLGLPPPRKNGVRGGDEPDRETIAAALKASGGNISRTAQSLGLSRQALYRRMERHGFETAGG